jgi:threonine synthase
MDVGAPSNWERIGWLFDEDLDEMRSVIRVGSVDDSQTARELVALDKIGYVACPHTAVGHRVLRDRMEPGESGLFLATAHPAKFESALEKSLGRTIPLPSGLGTLLDKPVLSTVLGTNHSELIRALTRSSR